MLAEAEDGFGCDSAAAYSDSTMSGIVGGHWGVHIVGHLFVFLCWSASL